MGERFGDRIALTVDADMNDPNFNIEDLRLPDSLKRDLDSVYGAAPSVSRQMDESILSDARVGLSRRMRFRRVIQVSAGAAASAAAIFLAVHLVKVTAPTPTSPLAQNVPGDIDHNGKVDILDAYVLARRIEAHRETPKDADFNHDGKTDAADVEAIASAAVRLPGGAVQ